jgi:prepilin-type N-terminal cleavage/methylation domain-containing protein
MLDLERAQGEEGRRASAAGRGFTLVEFAIVLVIVGLVLGGVLNAADESRLWWDHLRRAGFVAGEGTRQPFNVLTGLIGVQTGDGASPAGPALGGFVSLLVCSASLHDKIAIAVDGQIDDGAPNADAVRGQSHTSPNPDISGAAATVYTETGANVYTLCRAV